METATAAGTVVRDHIPTDVRDMASPAAEQVCGTPELLEMILLKLDLRTLLHAQKLAEPPTQALALLKHNRRAGRGFETKRMLNPFIVDRPQQLFLKGLFLWQNSSPGTPKTVTVDLHFASLRHAMALRSGKLRYGSWSEMLVVQPHHASIQWSLGFYEGGNVKSIAYVFLDGPPTLGMLVDALLEHFVPGHGQKESAGEEGRVEVAEAERA